jgi:pimeloyl-ACP methyl ester carboxylesterase
MFDRGSGAPIVVVPGIQGRWEWLRPALRALACTCRTVSYTLSGDLGSRTRMDWDLGLESLCRQLDGVLDETGLERAAICGVSYGGLVSVRYAATRPQRVSALILVSAPGPGWAPSARQARYASRPWVSLPAFCATAFQRLGAEIVEALPGWPSRIAFTTRYAAGALAAPAIPSVMARRVRIQQLTDIERDCARITAPTLVITGDAHLDRVVPVESTRRYVDLIAGARYEIMERTGHLGLLTQPDRFARIVSEFVHGHIAD